MKTMNKNLEQKKKQYEEVKIKISELQKIRKSLYNHIYITEMREKQKKVLIFISNFIYLISILNNLLWIQKFGKT